MGQEFLGTGWACPVTPQGTDKDIAVSQYEQDVREAILIILQTAPGEWVMRPDFGCGIHDLLFAVNNADTAASAAAEVREALIYWEPRIDILYVNVTPGDDHESAILIELEYRVRATNNRFNLVYPFYLE